MPHQKLKPILSEIENLLLENATIKPNFDKASFRASIYIFQTALMDKLFDLQDKEDMTLENRENMATQCGKDLRKFVKKYTDIDTFELFEN